MKKVQRINATKLTNKEQLQWLDDVLGKVAGYEVIKLSVQKTFDTLSALAQEEKRIMALVNGTSITVGIRARDKVRNKAYYSLVLHLKANAVVANSWESEAYARTLELVKDKGKKSLTQLNDEAKTAVINLLLTLMDGKYGEQVKDTELAQKVAALKKANETFVAQLNERTELWAVQRSMRGVSEIRKEVAQVFRNLVDEVNVLALHNNYAVPHDTFINEMNEMLARYRNLYASRSTRKKTKATQGQDSEALPAEQKYGVLVQPL